MSDTMNPAGTSRVIVDDGKREEGQKPEEFRQFEELAGKLTQVPKKELDEKRDEA